MITEIFIENQPVDVLADISSLLTFAIDDVKDFSARSTTWSKTVILPGTARNNALFGNIFETGISNDYNPTLPNIGYNFNPSKSARCLIFQDNLQTFKGTVRMLQIVHDAQNIEYEVALNGELTGLSVSLSSKLLSQLDFSAYNHQYSAANIVASWDNPGGSGYYYPLIDYGNYSLDKHNWDVKTFRPALYVKEYIDKIFAASNFRYQCDLFNTARFKSLIVPHNTKNFKRFSEFALSASTSGAHYLDTDGSTYNVAFVSHGVADQFQWNPYSQVLVYTGTGDFSGDITVTMGGTLTKSLSASSFNAILELNGAPIASQVFGSGQTSGGYGVTLTYRVTLHHGDFLSVFINQTGGGTWTVDVFGTFGIHSLGTGLVDIVLGANVPMNMMIPQNIRQVDFISSIVKLFNLYVVESQFDERMLYLTPFVDFYTPSAGQSVDWTYKIDHQSPVTIKPMSEINSKVYQFNYAKDSDYFNDLYQKRYNQGYGSYIYDTKFEFTSQTNLLELIFAPTPLVGYLGEDKVYPTIFKRTGEITGEGEEHVDSVIRILQTKKALGVSTWQMVSNETSSPTILGSYTAYGYAGHLDDPDNPSNDLNFGALKELFFVLRAGDLSKTQFNLYWSSYMAEITDKDSKMLVARFYLNPRDIFTLDFSKYVFVNGALFRLNKIIDYNATAPDSCEVELLKVINTSYAFAPTPPPTSTFYILWNDSEYVLDFDNSKILYQ